MKSEDGKKPQSLPTTGDSRTETSPSGISNRVAWLVLVISLVASAGGWRISRALEDHAAGQRMAAEAAAIRASLRERLSVYENVLHGSAGLFAASTSVERHEWRAYVERVSVWDRFPGIGALGHAAYVPRSELQNFLSATRADDAPDFTLKTGDDHGELLVVKFLEPEDQHQALIGLDMNSDPERSAIARKCRESGTAVISSQMMISESGEGTESSGFLMLFPIYPPGAAMDTQEQRLANCAGFVYARFLTAQLLHEVMEKARLPLFLQVIDHTSDSSEEIIFETGGTAGFRPNLIDEGAVRVGGRTWVLRLSSTPEFESANSRLGSTMAGVAGGLVSLLLFGIAWSLSNTRERAVKIAAGMTAKLRRINETLQHEILDREKAQRSIKDSEVLYHSLVESLPMSILRKDLEGRFTFANQQFCNEMGRAQDEVVGKTEFDVFPDGQAAIHKQEDERIMESGTSLDTVQEVRMTDEDARFKQVIKTPLRNGVGDVIGLQAILWDVTDKHRTEEELQHERDLLHTLLDNVPDRIYFKDEQSRFLRVSSAMVEFFKVADASEVIGKSDFDFFGEEHARQAYADEQQIIRTGRPVVDLVEREDLSDGACRWALTTKMPIRDASGRVVGTFGISREITQMKEAEAKLQHERDLLHTMLDVIPDRIYFKDQESRFLRVSRAVLDLHRLTDPSELIGKTDFDFFTDEHARQAFEDEQRIIDTGEPIIGLVEKVTLSGGEIRWASTTKMPLRNDQGEIVGTFGITRDVTEMKQASEALQKAKEAAEEASQTKSQFLANMSHELRTPLNSIIGFSNILKKNQQENLTQAELTFLTRILANGKHLLELINQILDLSKIEARKVELQLSTVRLDQLVKETIEQQEGLVRERPVELRCELPDTVAPVRTDPDKFKQVLINLIGNSLKFTEKGSVTVRVVTHSGTHQPLRIDVVDTGLGIPKEKLGAIFSAFQQAEASTARRFGGTGLGLTISQALCQLMGCRIEVISEVGKGSTFSIIMDSQPEVTGEQTDLALTESSAARTRMAGDVPAHVRGKRVLVIDDEADSRALLKHTLEEFGCEVVQAASGEEGLQLAHRIHPHLITVDLMMPRMSGSEVVGAIKADPSLKQIPVVVVSIVSGEHRGHILGAVDLLQKPIVREELLATLQRNLPRTRQKILVVDDHEDARQVMRSLLESENFEVTEAVNGREALEVLSRTSCDLILLDLLMPEVNGFTFLQTLRANPLYRDLPVVVVTAKELTHQEEEHLRREATDVLQKSAAFGHTLIDVLLRQLKLRNL